jgi:DNA-binding PadR family transcriptional regulator
MPTRNLGAAAYAILLALSASERHGYEILRQVAQDSQGTILLGPATLYTNLKRLLELKLITETECQTDDVHAEQRRYYRLSPTGRESLAAELERAEQFSKLGRRRLA